MVTMGLSLILLLLAWCHSGYSLPLAVFDLESLINRSPQSLQTDVKLTSAPVMTEDSFGYKLVQHNNPYLPGDNRLEQSIQFPISTTCSPNQVS